jgi:putative endopeptidase
MVTSAHRSRRGLVSVVLAGACAWLAPQTVAAQRPAHAVRLSALPALKVIDTSFIDHHANACTDFFQFANGAWLARDTIPAAYSSSGVARDMTDRNQLVVRSVLDEAMAARKGLPPISTKRKLGTFYATCMDSTAADRAGVTPVEPTLKAIAAINSRASLLSTAARLQTNGTNVLFRFGPEVNSHDANHYIAAFYQGGLGLPDRDYYTKAGASADSTRRAYVAHVAKLFTLSGESAADARRDADRVMALETEMAKASLTRVAQRDPAATDHPMPLARFQSLTPDVSWPAYFRTVGLTVPVTTVNVGMPDFFKRIDKLVATEPLDTWRAYLRYHALSQAAPWLSSPFVNEDFAFSSRFTGAREQLPRWKRCLRAADNLMGEALGQAYVDKTFPPEAKARAKAVIDDIRAAFGERIKHLDWMSPATKAQALNKLAKMNEKVGYPDTWRDYSALVVTDGPFINNAQRADAFEWKRTINRPGKAVDKTEWGMTVPTVNAYYDPSKNEMVFPAGALAPQTFDPKADDAANYGSLGGSWSGHELTHGFDDEGRHFDAAGNLHDWWAPADSAHFTQQANLVVKQFDSYVQVDTSHVNGSLTLGENIADYGGVLTAFDALQRALVRDGRPGLIEGFTPEQRFFLGYAQSWRSHNRPESLQSRLTVDPHAPERWRTNGPLSNDPEFAKAFGCKPGDPMVRSAALVPHIW